MKTAIIGAGNPLMGDDGAGIAVLELLKRMPLPSKVPLIDGGTDGMGLLHMLAGLDTVILVDAVDFGGAPGEIKVFSPNQVRSSKEMPRISLHESDLLQVIAMAEKLGQCPAQVIICAIQPSVISPTQALSAVVQEKLPVLAREIRETAWRLCRAASPTR